MNAKTVKLLRKTNKFESKGELKLYKPGYKNAKEEWIRFNKFQKGQARKELLIIATSK